MYCPQCGTPNHERDQNCRKCGAPLPSYGRGAQDQAEQPYGRDSPYGGGPGPATGPPPQYGPQQPYGVPPLPRFFGYAGFWKRFVAWIIDSVILSIVSAPISFGVGASSGRRAATSVIAWIIGWIYFSLLESSSRQATLGKMALGIVVTDLAGQRISWGRATVRYWSKLLSGLIFLIGYIMAGFTARKQALHDLIAGTLVINKPRYYV